MPIDFFGKAFQTHSHPRKVAKAIEYVALGQGDELFRLDE
jgi:hypothetical protein